MAHPTKIERNEAIARDYRAGATLRELAEKYGMHYSRISRLLKRHGARATMEERKARAAQHRPKCGRPRLYDDDPDKRAEYETLCGTLPAAQVHEILARK